MKRCMQRLAKCFCLAPEDQHPFGEDEAARATMSHELDLMQRGEIISHVQGGPVPAPNVGVKEQSGAAWFILGEVASL